MKIVYFGTDEFSSKVLAFLLEKRVDICAVVTSVDKPKGRALKSSRSYVKELLLEKNFSAPIYQPIKASDDEFVKTLKELKADLFVVVSYGQILKQNVLDVSRIGTINVHPSLLPKYRGASPIQSVILNGDRETGVTIMEMELAMDAGGIIRVEKTCVPDEMSYGELEEVLVEIAKKELLEVIEQINCNQKIDSTPQNKELATYTKKINVEDSFIQWQRSVEEICNFVRGMNPRPGARFFIDIDNKKVLLKVFKVKGIFHLKKECGSIISFNKDEGFIIGCKDGAISLLEVQLEGKKKMHIKDFINGFLGKIKIS